MRKLLFTVGLVFELALLSLAQTPNSTLQPSPTPTARRGPVKTLKFNRHNKEILGILPSSVNTYDYYISYFENPDWVGIDGTITLLDEKSNFVHQNDLSINFFFRNAGKKLIKPTSVELAIFTRTRFDGCVYKDAHSLTFRIDENPPEMVEGIISTVQVDRGKSCTEIFKGIMKYELFDKLASAKKVSVVFASKSIKLKDGKHLRVIRGLNRAIGVY